MQLKYSVLPIVLCTVLAGCAGTVTTGGGTKGPISGSAGGANSQNASAQLEKCSSSLGTVAIIEDASESWHQILTIDYRLPSVTPLIRLMVQQSNCFVVVDRSYGLNQRERERGLADRGEMRSNSNMGKGQLVAADYTITPTISFSEETGGVGAAIAGAINPIAGAIMGSVKSRQASVTLLMVDTRSSIQVAAAEGTAKASDFNLGTAFGNSYAAGLGGFSKTPEGRVIAGAFLDAYNQLVIATRSYSAQGGPGLGSGGALKTY